MGDEKTKKSRSALIEAFGCMVEGPGPMAFDVRFGEPLGRFGDQGDTSETAMAIAGELSSQFDLDIPGTTLFDHLSV